MDCTREKEVLLLIVDRTNPSASGELKMTVKEGYMKVDNYLPTSHENIVKLVLLPKLHSHMFLLLWNTSTKLAVLARTFGNVQTDFLTHLLDNGYTIQDLGQHTCVSLHKNSILFSTVSTPPWDCPTKFAHTESECSLKHCTLHLLQNVWSPCLPSVIHQGTHMLVVLTCHVIW